MSITSKTNTRYDVGLYIDINGGNAQDSGNTCVHESLFPLLAKDVEPTQTQLDSGIGDFYNADDDGCGDAHDQQIYNRTIVNGDISSASTTPMEITILCSDSTGNGYLDVAWGATWAQSAGTINCQSISDTVAGTKAKCQTGVTDSADAENPIPIGIPDLSLTISCSPDGVKAGETTTCAVDYANANNSDTGPADYIEFHLDYNETYGSVSNLTIVTNASGNDVASDVGGDYINWIIDANTTSTDRSTLKSIPKNTTGQFTFEYTVDSAYDNSVDQAIEFVATAFFNNSGTGVEQALTASDTVYLPVTVSYIYPKKSGDSIDIDFSTASETGNIGFNVYAVQGKRWTKLNSEIIAGSLDSFEPRDYHTSIEIPNDMNVKSIGITGIDISGREDRHGPFKIDEESGERSVAQKVDWQKVQKQIKASKKKIQKSAYKTTATLAKNQAIILNVSENAVYRVTHEDLLALDIDFSKKKAKNIAISFRGEGVARYIGDLDKRGKWTKDSWIEFMGMAPNVTDALYVDANRYILSLRRKLAVQSDEIVPLTAKEIILDKNNRYSYSTPSDDPFYEGYLITRNETAVAEYTSTFEMPIIEGEGTSSVKIDTYAFTEGLHRMTVALNGSEIANTTIEGKSAWIIEADIDNTLFRETGNELSFSLFGEKDGADMVVYDKMIVSY
ncbi:MAG: hypothetical protein DRG30_03580 [Epsilonproteobacteria bacterium]|nr:MAG: hypothetical protein DRG30_03580 [Campylobacterota bacterium]